MGKNGSLSCLSLFVVYVLITEGLVSSLFGQTQYSPFLQYILLQDEQFIQLEVSRNWSKCVGQRKQGIECEEGYTTGQLSSSVVQLSKGVVKASDRLLVGNKTFVGYTTVWTGSLVISIRCSSPSQPTKYTLIAFKLIFFPFCFGICTQQDRTFFTYNRPCFTNHN